MKIIEHIPGITGPAKVHLHRRSSVSNRYKYESRRSPTLKKLPVGKVGSLETRGSRDLSKVSSATPHTSKGIFSEGRQLRVVRTAAVAGPLTAGMVVGAVAAGFYGAANTIRYAKKEKTGTQAVKDTLAGSAGMGVSAGLGLAAANAIVGTTLALGSTVVIPIAAGAAAAFVSARIWNMLFFKRRAVHQQN